MHPLSCGCALRLSFVKYDTSDEGNPVAERMHSISCMVSKKMIWPGDKYRISLARREMCFVRAVWCFEMTFWHKVWQEFVNDSRNQLTVCAYSCLITLLYSTSLATVS
jgi:hypothetical protein